MILRNFGCLLIDNPRSKAYIQKLIANSYFPGKTIFVELEKKKKSVEYSRDPVEFAIDNAFRGRKYFLYSKSQNSIIPMQDIKPEKYASFDPDKQVLSTLEENGIEYEVVKSASLNGPEVINAIKKSRMEYFLFCGGAILGKEILSRGTKFIHIHPGYLPDVKGSMAIEWSILLYGKSAATAFFMEEQIDRGDIIYRKYFDPPELEHNSVPPLYSSHIRSEVLVEIMREFVQTGSFPTIPQDRNAGSFYYRMHPALHNIVFFQCTGPEKTRDTR
jgi:methionyl-tRNA formyltransferase